MQSELSNLHENILGEIPSGSFLKIKVKANEQREYYLNKIKEVVKSVITLDHNTLYEEWERELPKWFSQTMIGISMDILMMDKNKWHFESWIDAIIHREWYWYSILITDFGFEINLKTTGMPYMIDPFVYIIDSLQLTDYSIDEIL